MRPARLTDILEHEAPPSGAELRRIAAALAVPVPALYASNFSDEFIVPDFRQKDISATPPSTKLLKSIHKIHSILLNLAEFAPSARSIIASHNGKITKSEAQRLAILYRAKAEIDDQKQISFQNSNSFYKHSRIKIESWGIFVFQDSFEHRADGSGYAVIKDSHAAIVINTSKQSKTRRHFTLWHEFAHILLGRPGISDPYKVENSIERFCNTFAANLLAPDSVIHLAFEITGRPYKADLSNTAVFEIADSIRIGQEILLIRAEQLDITPAGFHKRWKERFLGKPHPDQSDPVRRSADPSPPDPLETKRSIFGNNFVRACIAAVNAGALDDFDIYRISGLKPKYFHSLERAMEG